MNNNLYKVVFGDDAGAKVYEALRSRFYDQASYTKGDPYHTAYVEGQREVLRFITAMMNQKNGNNE